MYSLLSSHFKMVSKKAKWSNYVHSHISGTQGVRLAHKSSSKFFLSAKCELAIFYVFGGKASEQESLHWDLLSELEMRGKRIRL